MSFKFPSNRRLHDKNTKAVSVAIDRIKTVAPIVQERYHNAFLVNGFPCIVYNKLVSGIKCSCSNGLKVSPTTPLLDDHGNASADHIQSVLTGSEYGIEDYGVKVDTTNRAPTFAVDIHNAKTKEFDISTETGSPFTTDAFADIDSTFLELESNRSTTGKCGLCFGTGFVGGFSLHNGMRSVYSTAGEHRALGYTIDPTCLPYSFVQDSTDGYVEFTLTLPFGASRVDALNVWNNQTNLGTAELLIGEDESSLVLLDKASILSHCTGAPVIVRVSGCVEFTHLEIQINLTGENTYMEYPKFTKTGDLNVIDAVGNVQIVVSPKVYQIQPWDIIIEVHNRLTPKYWRVTDNTDFKDRNSAVYGWEVNARLVQAYEIYRNLPIRQQPGQGQGQDLTTKLPRF